LTFDVIFVRVCQDIWFQVAVQPSAAGTPHALARPASSTSNSSSGSLNALAKTSSSDTQSLASRLNYRFASSSCLNSPAANFKNSIASINLHNPSSAATVEFVCDPAPQIVFPSAIPGISGVNQSSSDAQSVVQEQGSASSRPTKLRAILGHSNSKPQTLRFDKELFSNSSVSLVFLSSTELYKLGQNHFPQKPPKFSLVTIFFAGICCTGTKFPPNRHPLFQIRESLSDFARSNPPLIAPSHLQE
jgi:hypothetical protein